MKVLHLLASGGTGGIETLCKEYGLLSKNDNTFLFIWKGGTIANEMKFCHLHVIELDASKKDLLGPWKFISELCEHEKIQTVVVHHAAPIAHLYLLLLKRRFPQIYTVAYAHGNAVDMRGGTGNVGLKLKRKIIGLSLRSADSVIAISQSVRDSLIKYFNVNNSKIRVIYNGVDIKSIFQFPPQRHDKTQIIYVGRLIRQKGVENTLNALATIPKDIAYHFSIVGDGVYRSSLEKLTKKLHLEENVSFLGKRRDIPQLLSDSDIFVHAPLWEEGFGITIVEAMAAGLICVCTNRGAISEIIQNSISGIIVEKDNPEALAKSIVYAINLLDTPAAMEMKKQARKRAQDFSAEIFAEKLDLALSNYMEGQH